jgi:hypothetical protein
MQDAAFDYRLTVFRIGSDEIENIYIAVLANTMNPSKPLFQARGISRHVVVDHQMAKLKVDAFASGFSRNTDLGLCTEKLLRPFTFVRIHPTMDLAEGIAPFLKLFPKVVKRVAMFGEDEQFAAPIF